MTIIGEQPKSKGRRRFLKLAAIGTGAVGLGLGTYVAIGRELPRSGQALWNERSRDFTPNAWLHIDTAGQVLVRVNHTELGQGITTGLPTIVADELEVPWEQVRFELAPVEPAYGNPAMGGTYATGGSTSTPSSWDPLRHAGAAAREMLVSAAALRWKVAAATCRAHQGTVIHQASQRTLTYGELVEAAAKLPVPSDPTLKDPKDYRLIGTNPPRLDIPEKVTGAARYAIDSTLPRMLNATVVHPPVFGDTLDTFDARAALKLPGVRHVLAVTGGVAVVADHWYQAAAGAEALSISWHATGDRTVSTDSLWRRWGGMLDRGETKVLAATGDVDAALAHAATVLQAEYHVPFQAHATPEPISAVAHVEPTRCQVWVGTQGQDAAQDAAAVASGLKYHQVDIHTVYAGGGFGRRGATDEVTEAVELSKRLGVPIKVVWTRPEDIQQDNYRPACLHRLRAGLSTSGELVAWEHRIVGQDPIPAMLASAMGGAMPYWMPRGMRNGAASVVGGLLPRMMAGQGMKGGAAPLPYSIDATRLAIGADTLPIPVGPWRSVANSANPFAVECFLDEIAAAAKQDPVTLRRKLLAGNPRPLAALELAASKAGWSKPLAPPLFRGVALADFHGAFVAMIPELRVSGTTITVERVTCAIHAGRVINPRNVEQQVAGGLIFGLTATIKGAITLKDGRVEQSNFDDFPLLTMAEAPDIAVHLVPSDEPPLGVGESGVPSIAPAVANAVAAATGRRLRELPLMLPS